MIRYVVFVAGFFLGFSLEVRVQANERVQLSNITLHAPENSKDHKPKTRDARVLLEEPKGCLEDEKPEERPCAIQVGKRRMLTLKIDGESEITLGEDALVVRRGKRQFRLLGGTLRARGEAINFDTEFGSIQTNGEVFLDKAPKYLVLINTGNQALTLKGRGWSEEQRLDAGYEAELSRPAIEDGRASVTMPFPLNFDMQVVREARFFEGSKADFAKRLSELVDLRTSVQEAAARLHQEKAERKIASDAAEKQRVLDSRRARDAKDRELRALFRKRVLSVE